MKRLIFGAALAASVASAATAKPAIGDQPAIREGLIEVAIAYEVSQVCPSVSARYVRGLTRLNGLRSEALKLGYTRAEVDAYMNDDAEKNRLEAIARAALRAKGGVPGDVESHCEVARAEMAAGSAIGQLLR